jgi:Na+-driven multidrug efflux pump
MLRVYVKPQGERVTHARVIRIALPMTLAHLSTPLLGFADAAMIGRLGAAHLLGAIAAAAIVFDVVFWIFGFLRMGTAGLTAQAKGQGDASEEAATLARALIVALALGFSVILLQTPIAAAASLCSTPRRKSLPLRALITTSGSGRRLSSSPIMPCSAR